jgi:hypothetical protein
MEMSESNTGSAAPVESAPANAEIGSQEISTSNGNAQAGENLSAEQAQVQEALENGDAKEAQRLVKKYQLKVRGKTVEREVDLSDDDFMKNQLQLAEMSKISMQEASELKKAYQKEMERFKSNPWEVLQDLGFDPDELAELRIQQRIEEMKKSPEQLEKEKYQKELEEARAEAKNLKKKKKLLKCPSSKSKRQFKLTTKLTKLYPLINLYQALPTLLNVSLIRCCGQ